jgi:3',5'-cyclic AMP phosphodiesterase CpdA
MGNHEALNVVFPVGSRWGTAIDKFPWTTSSAEAVFAGNFVNPVSDLKSEDGSKYDPDRYSQDFPSYKETVYSYKYGNTAIIVLNSNYWYAPLLDHYPQTSGNLHGYIMDNQLKWLEKELNKFEKDEKIKHVFVTIHTPAFPNGGHSTDDMWYSGNNIYRPVVAGKEVEKGIIQRRDDFLNIIINKSKKVAALLTGDEHNYCRLLINDEMKRYPKNYSYDKLKLERSIYQINNGAAGAPYYAQENLPWSEYTKGFTTQNALVIISVKGDKISVKVVNPDTLEIIENYDIR